METVVEKRRQGRESSMEDPQMVRMKTRATVLDIRGSRGLTMAMYLRGREKKTGERSALVMA